MSSLPQNILATLCYYDCLDMPLTAFEVWKNIINSHQLASLNQGGSSACLAESRRAISHQKMDDNKEDYTLLKIIEELGGQDLSRYIEEFQGFYFLKGRKGLMAQRIRRGKISAAKIKKLRKIVKILRLVPFVRMIALTGRLAMKNAESGSDWDVLVVLEKNRIWTGRTLVTLASHLLGSRRHGNKIKDRICLNHFITVSSLEIKLQDLFSAHEYSWIRPVFDSGIFEKFQVRNSWIRDYRPNYSLAGLDPLGTIEDGQISKNIRKFFEKLVGWDFLEDKLRAWQKQKIEKNPKTSLRGSYIEATDEALIFLPEPQGPKVYECYQKKITRLAG